MGWKTAVMVTGSYLTVPGTGTLPASVSVICRLPVEIPRPNVAETAVSGCTRVVPSGVVLLIAGGALSWVVKATSM